MWLVNNKTQTLSHRKILRKRLTPPEARLWVRIKGSKMGRKFRRQHSVGPFILDFYCPSEKLAVEVDGEGHDNPDAYDYDRQRTEYINSLGIKVMRYTNLEIKDNLEGVLQNIKQEFKKTTPPQAALPSLVGGEKTTPPLRGTPPWQEGR